MEILRLNYSIRSFEQKRKHYGRALRLRLHTQKKHTNAHKITQDIPPYDCKE